VGSHVRYAAGDIPGTPLKPRDSTGRRAFRVALVLLPLGVIGNVAYTLLATDRAILDSLGSLPRGYLAVALALGLTPWLTGTARLWIWTRFLKLDIPLRDVVRMTLVVDLGGAVAPTAGGGEAFKWGLLLRHGVKPGAAASLAILPKIEDALFFALALPVAIVWTRAWRLPVVESSVRLMGGNIFSVLAGVGALAIVVCIVLRLLLRGHAGARVRDWSLRTWGRMRRRLRRTWREARAVFRLILRRGKASLALAVACTALHWTARYSVISALMLFLGVPFDPVLLWLLQWVVFTIMTFVPTPGATGAAEVAFTAVYATLLPSGVLGVATAGWRFFTFYAPVALAAIFFTLLGRREGN